MVSKISPPGDFRERDSGSNTEMPPLLGEQPTTESIVSIVYPKSDFEETIPGGYEKAIGNYRLYVWKRFPKVPSRENRSISVLDIAKSRISTY
jgi:hypothetical protein